MEIKPIAKLLLVKTQAEGVPVKMVEGEALGNPTVDLLGLSVPDGAGAGEFGSRATFYFQLGLICLAVPTRLRVPGATRSENDREQCKAKHDRSVGSQSFSFPEPTLKVRARFEGISLCRGNEHIRLLLQVVSRLPVEIRASSPRPTATGG